MIAKMYSFGGLVIIYMRVVFQKAIDTAEASEEIKERVLSLIDNITFCVWRYTTRGLFERDKLIFTYESNDGCAFVIICINLCFEI
jgi:hypothetical protein